MLPIKEEFVVNLSGEILDFFIDNWGKQGRG